MIQRASTVQFLPSSFLPARVQVQASTTSVSSPIRQLPAGPPQSRNGGTKDQFRFLWTASLYLVSGNSARNTGQGAAVYAKVRRRRCLRHACRRTRGPYQLTSISEPGIRLIFSTAATVIDFGGQGSNTMPGSPARRQSACINEAHEIRTQQCPKEGTGRVRALLSSACRSLPRNCNDGPSVCFASVAHALRSVSGIR